MLLNKREKIWKLYEKSNLKKNIYDGDMYFSEREKEIMIYRQKKVLIESKSLIFIVMISLFLIKLIDNRISKFSNSIILMIVIVAIISILQYLRNRKNAIELVEESKIGKGILKIDYLKIFKIIIIGIYLISGIYLWKYGTLGYDNSKFRACIVVANILVIIYLLGCNIYYYFIKKFIVAATWNLSKAIKRGAIVEVKKSVEFEGRSEHILGEDYAIFFKTLEVLIDKVEEIELSKNKALKHKAEVITNASHDIKTPLTSIKNYIYILENKELNNKEKAEYINILKVKIENLYKLIENLKLATESSNENLIVKFENVEIIDLINKVLEEYNEEFLEKKINIKNTENIENIKLKCDVEFNKTIFRNIFSNINKYALEESEVTIEIKKENEFLSIYIKNKSKEKIVINPEELIGRFKRGDESRHNEGHGLGLDIVSNLVRIQGGKFNIEVIEDEFTTKTKYLL